MGSTDGTRWQVASATTIGSLHVREHLPNQDSTRTWAADDGSAAIAVVADGHGHHLHFRSDVGADLATSLTLEALQAAIADDEPVDPVEVAVDVITAWRRAVLAHVETHPLRSDEAPRGPLVPYGTTLVAVAVTGDRLVALQVGDGDTVVVTPDGQARRPLPEDPSLDGRLTASLCQHDPVASLRTARLDLSDQPVALAYVCTDGLGKARVDHGPTAGDARAWWAETGRELAATAGDGGLDALRARLPRDVRGPAQVGGDDTTLALVALG